MPKPFNELRERLLRAGVAPRHVRRYLSELDDHLADLIVEEQSAGRSPKDAESVALLRLGTIDNLSSAMLDKRQLQSWSARAPWATFGLAPVVLLAVAYFVACFILWAGWQMFLPAADTPFGGGHLHGLENIYFQAGKFYYIAAPVLVGWGVALVAARQRVRPIWPILGAVPIALIGATNQVHANRTTVHGGLGHISMNFVLGTSVQDVYGRLFYTLGILVFTLLPYLLWRLQRTRSHPAQGG